MNRPARICKQNWPSPPLCNWSRAMPEESANRILFTGGAMEIFVCGGEGFLDFDGYIEATELTVERVS